MKLQVELPAGRPLPLAPQAPRLRFPFRAGLVGLGAAAAVILAALRGGLGTEAPPDAVARVAGTVEARELLVPAQGGGTLSLLWVEEGQAVAAGEPIAHVDSADAVLALRAATARLAGARARLADRRARPLPSVVAAAEARLAEAQVQLEHRELELARVGRLADSGAASSKERVDADAALRLAQRRLASRQRALERDCRTATAGELAELAAAVAELEVARDQTRLALSRTRLVSPVAGTVQRVHRRAGEFVARGAPVVTLLPAHELHVEALVDGRLHALLAPGQRLEVQLDALDGPLPGEVSFLADRHSFIPRAALTRSDRARLAFLCRVRLLDPPAGVKPGMFAELVIRSESEPAASRGTGSGG